MRNEVITRRELPQDDGIHTEGLVGAVVTFERNGKLTGERRRNVRCTGHPRQSGTAFLVQRQCMVRHIIKGPRFIACGIRRIINHAVVGAHLVGDDEFLTNQVHRINDRRCVILINIRLVGVHLVLCFARHLIDGIAEHIVYTRAVFRPDTADSVLGRLIYLHDERILTIDSGRVTLFQYIHLRLSIIGDDLLRVVLIRVIHRVA